MVGNRILQFVNQFGKLNIDAFLVTDDINITYLTQFPSSESWLLILPQKTFYITDFRYYDEAKKKLKGIFVRRYRKSLVSECLSILQEFRVKRVGFNDAHLSCRVYKKIHQESFLGVKFVTGGDILEQMRAVKEPQEIQKIQESIKLNLIVFNYIGRVLKPGLTEKDLFYKVEGFVRSRRAEFSFDPIIASGPNSCFPHAKITTRRICRNEPVLVDLGVQIDGYKSDLTRMFFLGKITPHLREVFKIVKDAQHSAIEKIKPGVPAGQIDLEARKYLQKHKLAKYFGHSLGHGVGLEIHEHPKINKQNQMTLKESMIFTVEPAVYIPNQFGVRIEDMVLVTGSGAKVLSY